MGVNLVPIRSRSDSESPAVMTRRKTIVTLRWLRRALASSVSGALCGLLAAAVALGVAELVAVVIGIVARRWLPGGLAGLAIFGALGVSAAATRPNAQLTDVVPTLAGVAVGMITLVILVRTASSGKITLRRRDAVVLQQAGQSGRIGSAGALGSTGPVGSSGSAWRSGTTGQPGKPGLPGSAGVPGSAGGAGSG